MYENFAAVIKSNSAEWKRLEAIDPARLPQHIAIIMDGNGRWAKKRGRPRIFGHRAGADSVRSIIDTCTRLEVKAVTLYAFSTEIWKRPKTEISGLMGTKLVQTLSVDPEHHQLKIVVESDGGRSGQKRTNTHVYDADAR